MEDNYICCFCAKPVNQIDSIVLEVYAFSHPDEKICLFAHKLCYRTSIIPEVPLLPELLD
jgi:hypothetical protein